MKNNFEFLEKSFPILEKLGGLAEKYLYTDPNSCLIKLEIFAESIVNCIFELDIIDLPKYDNTHANRIKILKNEGLLPKDIDEILFCLRNTRNKALHSAYESINDCKTLLKMAHTLAVWFMQTYGDWNFVSEEFILPEQSLYDENYSQILKEKQELEEKIKQLSKLNLAAIPQKNITIKERKQRSNLNANNLNLSEKETRYLIDEQLRKVGWEHGNLVSSRKIWYNKNMKKITGNIEEYFDEAETVKDYYGYFYSLIETIIITILGTFCGLKSIKQIQKWAVDERIRAFLKEYCGITEIPSYSWFTQILGVINPQYI